MRWYPIALGVQRPFAHSRPGLGIEEQAGMIWANLLRPLRQRRSVNG